MSKLKFTAIIPAVAAFLLVLFAGPGAAYAGNLVANPGFESPCPGAACVWEPGGGSTIATLAAPHSGSLALQINAQDAVGGHEGGQCVTGLAPGTYDFSYWYEKPAALTVYAGVQFYSGPTCDGSFLDGPPNLFGAAAGAWAQATTQVTAPAGTQSAELYLYVSCDAGCTPPTSGLFDDVSLTAQGTTAATLRSFTASRTPAGTLVRWRTAAETEVAGFNVYRVANGRRLKVNKRLIAAKGKGGGASYRFLDRGHRGASYRLEIVNLDGTRQWRTVR